jgi:uncharacterized protein (DUF849 family)
MSPRLTFLEAAINGPRERGDHPELPLTPAQQARTAAACRAQGADAVHAHVRDAEGRETLAADAVASLVRALRAAVPGLPAGVSTGAWIEPDPRTRVAQVRGWGERPDFASVNFDEVGALEVADALLAMGVGIEAGLASAAAAETFVASGIAPRCLRVLLEPQDQALPAALTVTAAMEQILTRAGVAIPRLLHGTGATAWALLAEAVRRGHQARIGLEDTLLLPDGRVAPDNAALVVAARRMLERPPC